MGYFYDLHNDVFYNDEIHDIDSSSMIAVTDDDYYRLLNGRATGGVIYLNGSRLEVTPPRPTQAHDWDGKSKTWIVSPEKLTALLTEQQALMWEKIKQKRYDNLRSGVYVKSIGKWFHSNDESRQQYTFLRTLSDLPENLMWKTMDNSFVKVTKAILDELTLQLILDEQADFMNAERHKALMEQAENPLEYDFSSGWVRTFAEAVNE